MYVFRMLKVLEKGLTKLSLPPLYHCMQVMSSQRLQNRSFSDRMCIDKILLEGEKKLNWYFPAFFIFVHFLFATENLKSFASNQILDNAVI